MIPIANGVRVWIATGHTDMRKGMHGLALQVQQGLKRDPNAGDLYVFRGRTGSLVKILWHDGLGTSLYTKRLDRGRFTWPSATDGVVAINADLEARIALQALQIELLKRDRFGQCLFRRSRPPIPG